MITTTQIRHSANAGIMRTMPFGLGNTLFMIASTIGIAVKNGYDYGFDNWINQEYFVNPLPKTNGRKFKSFEIPKNYKGCDIGFQGFDVPDNSDIKGYLGSWKYFDHCRDLIKHYFMMPQICEPLKDCIIINYRDYSRELNDFNNVFRQLDYDYFQKALCEMPDLPVYVISDNSVKAKEVIRENFIYLHNEPIIDFYLISNADYLVMSPSTFSWWGAFLSGAKTVAPFPWFVNDWADCPIEDLYLPEWILL